MDRVSEATESLQSENPKGGVGWSPNFCVSPNEHGDWSKWSGGKILGETESADIAMETMPQVACSSDGPGLIGKSRNGSTSVGTGSTEQQTNGENGGSFMAWRSFVARDRQDSWRSTGRPGRVIVTPNLIAVSRDTQPSAEFWANGVSWDVLAKELETLPVAVSADEGVDGEVRIVELNVEKAAVRLGRLRKTAMVLQVLEASPSRDRVVAWAHDTMEVRLGVTVSQVTVLSRQEFLILLQTEEEREEVLARPPGFLDGKAVRLVNWENRNSIKVSANMKVAWVELRDLPPFLEDQVGQMLAALGPVVHHSLDKLPELRYATENGQRDFSNLGGKSGTGVAVAGSPGGQSPQSPGKTPDADGFIPVHSKAVGKTSLEKDLPCVGMGSSANPFAALAEEGPDDVEEDMVEERPSNKGEEGKDDGLVSLDQHWGMHWGSKRKAGDTVYDPLSCAKLFDGVSSDPGPCVDTSPPLRSEKLSESSGVDRKLKNVLVNSFKKNLTPAVGSHPVEERPTLTSGKAILREEDVQSADSAMEVPSREERLPFGVLNVNCCEEVDMQQEDTSVIETDIGGRKSRDDGLSQVRQVLERLSQQEAGENKENGSGNNLFTAG
ncbi:hypothetical protein R1sor_025439 [Riccia sorocarpa]|uniref:DUF4283 domain-containing protein n=1 Tax=Riccia sorocarpa TaxID=122646 RepID=A0ABD3GCA3_9MARC